MKQNICIYYEDIKQLLRITDPKEQKEKLLETINTSRILRQSQKPQPPKFQCRVCFGLFDPQEIVPIKEILGFVNETEGDSVCNHKICKECLRARAEEQIRSPQVFVTCPVDGCTTKFRNPERMHLLNLIDDTLFDEYRKKLLNNFRDKKVFKVCPCCKTEITFPKTRQDYVKTKCTVCNQYFCFQCSCPWHDNYNCQQWQNRLKMEQLHPLLPVIYTEGLKFIQNASTNDVNIKLKIVHDTGS